MGSMRQILSPPNKLIARVSLAEAKSPYPYALMLPQSDTERLLDDHLNGLGVHVERQVELLQFSAGENGVETTLRWASGGEEHLTVDWLIGCDGAHSTVRHGLGMSFSGSTLDTDWMLADVHLKAFPFPASELATYWHEKGVLVALPISPGRYRVIADLGPSTGRFRQARRLLRFRAVLDQRGPGGLVAHDPIWLSSFRINERKVADYEIGPRVSRRRCCACSQSGRRAGHEYRHAGCFQSCLEAGAGLPRHLR